MFKNLFLGLLLSISASAVAGVLLPLQTLRNQASTAHCWAYASGHMLESRAQAREMVDFMFTTEQDTKYWVDFERLMYIWRTKKDFYFDFSYEGGWQIEFMNSLLKYGKVIKRSQTGNAQVWYNSFSDYTTALPFEVIARPTPDRSLPETSEIAAKMRGNTLVTEADAMAYANDILTRQYGRPMSQTKWFGQTVDLKETTELVFGSDNVTSLNAFVLVKPTNDGNYGWSAMISERFFGFRMETSKVLSMIKKSLDKQWPVTFDNVYHAMTIIGYDTKDGVDYFAVADSVPGKITWYSASRMPNDLNLVTFYRAAIAEDLPAQTKGNTVTWPKNFNSDKYDYIDIPPGH